MEPPKLTITVSGACNTGKSTIATLLAEFLLLQGVRVKIEDEPHPDGWASKTFDRFQWLRKRDLSCTVQTVQIARER
jgi:deoxyadenosine/deoxycytidine kinase